MALSQIETASLSSALVAPTATALTTASGSAPSYSARAWVNFNGTGTVAIRASGNVSSITDLSVGQYTINFAAAMVDVNYAGVAGGGAYNSTAVPVGDGNSVNSVCFEFLTSSVKVGCSRLDSVAAVASDSATVQVAIFR